MRTLYAPIYEAGSFHENAVTQKRGLYNALLERGGVTDFDYLANDRATLYAGFVQRIEYLNAELVFCQFHSGDDYIYDCVSRLRQRFPDVRFVNWSGDSWLHSLIAEPILKLAKLFDVWMVAAPDVLPIYAENGINGKFLQIAYEPPVIPLPHMPSFDVVFMGNIISERRRELRTFLRSLPYSVGIYGDGDGTDGHNTYAFAAGESLYKNAKIAIADAAYVDQRNYVSNRPLQIMGAGGAILLHQHVDKMGVLIEGIDQTCYAEWDDFEQLRWQIDLMLSDAEAARAVSAEMASSAQKLVLSKHTWRNRVDQLMGWLGEIK